MKCPNCGFEAEDWNVEVPCPTCKRLPILSPSVSDAVTVSEEFTAEHRRDTMLRGVRSSGDSGRSIAVDVTDSGGTIGVDRRSAATRRDRDARGLRTVTACPERSRGPQVGKMRVQWDTRYRLRPPCNRRSNAANTGHAWGSGYMEAGSGPDQPRNTSSHPNRQVNTSALLLGPRTLQPARAGGSGLGCGCARNARLRCRRSCAAA